MKVYEIYSEVLKQISSDCIYGVPGSFIMPLWWEISRSHRVILVRHESGAVFMADGYARASGNMGIALTTVGPGVTNAITGIACAYQDSIPLLVISGMGPISKENVGMFQNCAVEDRGFSSVKLLQPITKRVFLPKTKEEAINCLYEGIRIANTGRKGPVHISLPLDIQEAEINPKMKKVDFKVNEKEFALEQHSLNLISEYKRPIILCGWGVHLAKAGEKLEVFSRKLHIPVVATVKGVSACSISNPYYWGIVGNILKKSLKERIWEYNPDLVIVMGSSLSMNSCPEFEDLFKSATIMQIDIDERQFDRYKKVKYQINCDMKQALEFMLKSKIKVFTSILPIAKEHLEKESYFAGIVKCMNKILPKESVVIPDAGNHWLDVLYGYNPKSIFGLTTNNGLGSMGHAIGSAIGIARSMPEKKVVCVSGDGSILMSGEEISTAVNYGVNIIFVVENNNGLGRVRIGQIENKVSTESSKIEKFDIQKYAQSLGAKAYKCHDLKTFDKTFCKALDEKGTIVIEVQVDEDDYPTVLQK